MENERLVAYLDGELSGRESEAVESLLSSDQSARERLQSLDRVWNALDALPRATATPSFTQSTVAMVAARAGEEVVAETQAQPAVRRRGFGAGVVIALVGVSLGAAGVWGMAGLANRQLLTDLPVIANASALEQAGSTEFLLALIDDLPEVVESLTSDETREQAEVWTHLQGAAPPARREWLRTISDAEREELGDQAVAFRAATSQRRESLRGINRAIAEDPQAELLRTAALAYGSLVSARPSGERARLRGMSTERRINELKRRANDWTRDALSKLNDAENSTLWRAVEQLGGSPEVLEWIDRQADDWPTDSDRWADNFRRRPERLFALAARAEGSSDPERYFGLFTRPRRRDPPEELLNAVRRFFHKLKREWPVWSEQLAEALPERVHKQLKETDRDSERTRLWIDLLSGASPQDAARFAGELENDELARLLAAPVGEMQEGLRRLMAEEILGFGPDRFSRGRGRGPGRGGRPSQGPGRFGPTPPPMPILFPPMPIPTPWTPFL